MSSKVQLKGHLAKEGLVWGWVEHEGNGSSQPIRSSEQLIFVPVKCLSHLRDPDPDPDPGLTAQQQQLLSTYHVLSPVLSTLVYIKSFNPHNNPMKYINLLLFHLLKMRELRLI